MFLVFYPLQHFKDLTEESLEINLSKNSHFWPPLKVLSEVSIHLYRVVLQEDVASVIRKFKTVEIVFGLKMNFMYWPGHCGVDYLTNILLARRTVIFPVK